MKTSDIRRAIDASLSGLKLTPEQRSALLKRAMAGEEPSFQRRRRSRKLARRLLLAAIILLLMLTMIVPAVGGQSHRAVFRQTDEALELNFGHRSDSGESFESADFPPEIGEIWGEEFLNRIIEWKAEVLLPRWVPEGFRPSEVNVIPDAYIIDSWLRRGDEHIQLNIHVLPEGQMVSSSIMIESEPGTDEIWELGGIEYHYTTNYTSNSVAWVEGNCAVYISAPRDRDAMRKMIESIYGE